MTKSELEAEANRLIIGAKYALELQNEFRPVFLFHGGGKWRSLPMPKGTEQVLNSGAAKREIFGFCRRMVQEAGCDGVIFATDAWQMKLTPEAIKLDWKQHVDSGFAKLVEMGWATREETITITAQSQDDVLIIAQPYRRMNSGIQLLTSRRVWCPQNDFKGRQKMFGDLREENLGEHPDGKV